MAGAILGAEVSVIRGEYLFLAFTYQFQLNVMKNKTFLWSLLLGLLFVYSCSDDTPGLSVDLPEGASVVLEAQYGADSQLSFHASQG